MREMLMIKLCISFPVKLKQPGSNPEDIHILEATTAFSPSKGPGVYLFPFLDPNKGHSSTNTRTTIITLRQ